MVPKCTPTAAQPYLFEIFWFSFTFRRTKNIFILDRFKKFWMFWKAMSLNRSFLGSMVPGDRPYRHPQRQTWGDFRQNLDWPTRAMCTTPFMVTRYTIDVARLRPTRRHSKTCGIERSQWASRLRKKSRAKILIFKKVRAFQSQIGLRRPGCAKSCFLVRF